MCNHNSVVECNRTDVWLLRQALLGLAVFTFALSEHCAAMLNPCRETMSEERMPADREKELRTPCTTAPDMSLKPP